MKKKLLILVPVLVIILIMFIAILSYAPVSKENPSKKNHSQEVKQENDVHNSEKNDEQVENEEKSELDESYTQQKDETDNSSQSYTQQSSASSNNSISNSSNSSNSQNNNSKVDSTNSKIPENNNQENKDEETWNEFKSSPLTLMILDADKPDWETRSEQEAEAQKWIDLGYRVEEPYACIDLLSGKRCVYSLLVYMSKGVCNETPNEIPIDWRKKNYIGIVSYAKSLGYSCEGYQD